MRLFITLSILTLAAVISTVTAGEPPWKCDVVPGVVVFKVTPELKSDLPPKGAHRFGIAEIDRLMDEIDAVKVELKHPFCLPPKPGETDLTRTYNLYFPETISVDQVCADLGKLNGIEYAEPWLIYRYFMEHNDPDRDEQWGLDICQANDAHDLATGDRTVGIALIDMGMDMDHSDLEDNIWINPREEDNNQDDDENGKVDDFHGWDFVDDDNDPDDPTPQVQGGGHGTHTAGIASAVTNNRIGIASVGYSCGIIPVRTGGAQGIRYGVEGIEYAATTGAKVISCSWGGYQPMQQLEDVIDYAYEHDALVVAAAGNENVSNRSYPASYDHVIAVAATDQDDRKWVEGGRGGSNYGEWVDVSAPGVDIYSTMLDGEYFTASGTSMACPFAGSVAILLRSKFPELSIDEITALLLDGADDIDDQNANYRGQLGSGRINAYQSLLLGPLVLVEIGDLEVIADDNDDGVMDAGETVDLAVTISLDEDQEDSVEDLVVMLTSEDPDITINVDRFEYEELEPGGSFFNDENPFELTIDADADTHTTYLIVSVDSEPFDLHVERTFEMVIGPPEDWVFPGDGAVVESFTLESVYPNPFNSTLRVDYVLPEGADVELNLYDLSGRLVAELIDGRIQAGVHTGVFDGSNLVSGIYILRYEAAGNTSQMKVVLVK